MQQAQSLGCDCLQIFSKSPRSWNAPPLDAEKCASFRTAWKDSGFSPLVVHDSYLINLAAPDETARRKSVAAMIDEVERADALGADFLVTHCGAHLQKENEDSGANLFCDGEFSPGVAAGLATLVQSLREVLDKTPNANVKIALENTAGQGTCLGGPFEHLAFVLNEIKGDRLRVCFDTCHAHAAGHAIESTPLFGRTLQRFDEIIGLDKLAIIHFNDSKGEAGKHLDRHEHIGQGNIGREAMRGILCHPQLQHLPFILETPDVETMIEANLNAVRELREK